MPELSGVYNSNCFFSLRSATEKICISGLGTEEGGVKSSSTRRCLRTRFSEYLSGKNNVPRTDDGFLRIRLSNLSSGAFAGAFATFCESMSGGAKVLVRHGWVEIGADSNTPVASPGIA